MRGQHEHYLIQSTGIRAHDDADGGEVPSWEEGVTDTKPDQAGATTVSTQQPQRLVTHLCLWSPAVSPPLC